MRRHVVEVLFQGRCPTIAVTIERARAAVARFALDVDVELRLVRVDTNAEALTRQLRGSPSVRIDGVDVEPAAAGRPLGTYGREYVDGDRRDLSPPESWIRAALARSVETALGSAEPPLRRRSARSPLPCAESTRPPNRARDATTRSPPAGA